MVGQFRSRKLLLSALLSSACLAWSSAPAAAATPSCSPTPNGNTGSASRTAASGTQLCTGGDTGIDYQATGGNLIVDLNNDPITGHAININDDGLGRNITVNIGLPSSGYTAASVFADDSSNNGVKLVSTGGDISLATYTGGTITYSGTSTSSFAINAQTSGSGTITILTGDAVTDTLGTGIAAQTVNGTIGVTVDGNITAANFGLYEVATGSGNTTATLGTGVTVMTPVVGIYASSATGTSEITLGTNDTITTEAASRSYGLVGISSEAPLSAATTTTVQTGSGDSITVTGQNSIAIFAVNEGSGLGGVTATVGDSNTLTVNGDTSVGVFAATTDIANSAASGAGNITVSLGSNDVIDVMPGNGTGTELSASAGVAALSNGGNVLIQWTGTGGSVDVTAASGIDTVGLIAETSGTGTATVSTGVGTTIQTGNGDGIDGIGQNGAISLTALGDVTATGGDALHAYASGTGDITIVAGSATDPVTIQSTESAHSAVWAGSLGGDIGVTTYGSAIGGLDLTTSGSGTITVNANGTIEGLGDFASIYATTENGAIMVTTNGAITDGLNLEATGTGNVTVTTNAAVTEPGPYAAIFASSNGGDVQVTTNSTIGSGISADTTGTGTVTVSVNGNVTNTQNFDTVYLSGQNGAVGVAINSGTVMGTQGYHDIFALASGTGNVTATLGNDVILEDGSKGIFAHSVGGTVSVTTGTGDSITAADTDSAGGITARSDLAPATSQLTASIMTGANTTISIVGDDSVGLAAVNEGGAYGATSVTTGTGNSVTVTGNTVAGVVSSSINLFSGSTDTFSGAGNATVTIGAANTILVDAGTDNGGLLPASAGVVAGTQGGDVSVNWAGAGGTVTVNGQAGVTTTGIFGYSGAASDSATVSIVTGNGTTITSNNGYGIVAIDANSGATTVTSNGAIITQAPSGTDTFAQLINPNFTAIGGGIIAFGNGPVTVTSNGSISVRNGDGIDVISQGIATVTSNSSITADHSAVVIAGATSDMLTNAGTMEGAGSQSHPVIVLEALNAGATATVTNDTGGTIRSTAGLAGDLAISVTTPGAGAVTIDNNGTIIGTMNFADASAATVANSGTWSTTGTSVFSSGTNVLNNSGTVIAQGSTSFQALQTFNNTGLLDMHSANGTPGDVTTIPGAFVGGAGSKIAVDAALGTTASGANCGAIADCLKIGSSSGTTSIIVHDTLGASAAGYNTGGILLVSGATTASNFVLDPASTGYNASTKTLDIGAFDYALGFSNGQERLFSDPSAVAHQLPELVTGAANLWFETSPWLSRQADLRDQRGPDGSGDITPGFWLKATGNFAQRETSTSTTIGGTSVTYDTSYHQDSYGIIAGTDMGTRGLWDRGDSLVAGLMGGYISSDLDFTSTGVSAHLSGAMLGAYVTYLDGQWVIDAAFKANLLTLRYDSAGASLFDSNPAVRSYGGEIDTGKRMFMDETSFIEPLASIAYVSTAVDSTTIMGTPTSFGNGSSGRASVGARFGTLELSSPENIVDVSLTGRLWDAFGGSSGATLVSSSANLPVTDNFNGIFGEVGGNMQILDRHDGWSSFIATSVKFKDHFTSETVTAGVRYHW